MIRTEVEVKAKEYLSKLGKHFEGIWRHVKVRLEYLRENWWQILKDVGWSLIWPIPGTIRDIQKITKHLKSAWDNSIKLNFQDGIEELINAWREGNALVSRYYGWLFLASVIIGGLIGGIAGVFEGGLGAIPGALAGIKVGAAVAGEIGYALLISSMAAEIAMLVKSITNIGVANTQGKLEEEYGQIADSALALGIMGAFMILGALAARFSKAVVSRIARFILVRTKTNMIESLARRILATKGEFRLTIVGDIQGYDLSILLEGKNFDLSPSLKF